MDDMRPVTHVVIAILFVISWLTIPMRMWVRGVSMNSFGWDDWVMSSIAILLPGQQGLLYFFMEKGAGLHIEEVMATAPQNMTILLKGLLAEEFYYVFVHFMVKMCFLLFFFRLSNTPIFRWSLWGVIAFNTIGTICIWLFYGLQCRPLEAFYHPEKYPEVKCVDSNVAYFFPFALILSVDISILILPIPTVARLQMAMKRKLAVIGVVTTGGMAVLAGALRAIVLFEFANSADFTWVLGKMVIVSAVEIDLAIIAANMPALKAFYKCWRNGKLGAGQGASLMNGNSAKDSHGSFHGSRSGNMELSSGMSRPKAGVTTTAGPMERLPSTESEEELFDAPKQKPKRAEYESSWRSTGAESQ